MNNQSEITNFDECKWNFVYMLESHDLNCEGIIALKVHILKMHILSDI